MASQIGTTVELVKQHIRSTFSLMVREMSTRYGGKPGGYLWALIDPVAHIALLSVVFGTIARAPALGSSFMLFFATGYLPLLAYNSMTSFVAGAVRANRALLNYPVVAPADTVAARFIVQALTTAFICFLVLGLISVEDHRSVFAGLEYSIVFFSIFVAMLLGLGVGMANIALFARSPLYEQIYSIVTKPLFLISGVFFLADSIPQPFRGILLLNPIAHIIMWFRSGVYSEYRAVSLDVSYALQCAFVAFFLGVLLFTFSASHLREEKN
ncbi:MULTISPECIES: ABC transporter permease [Ensifer]|uniref:Transport permease protein n=1 Tax=Ensifer adhaerens TaxID=106592 RepID=A0ABY8HN66_ENSAD|nr:MULTISPECIES: ABC transporter permease [Ensifer]ANK75785.1 sugar ABC transporter [Ensifer adhaerens]KQZ48007.1 sugar ABC transporter [Ensifer sp. Root558]WFP92935.1 ABC transporter permease [Ensifer adhaerens]SFH04886.1 capsular polysaccharide transport system permease protein [Ensifer sp. OV372]